MAAPCLPWGLFSCHPTMKALGHPLEEPVGENPSTALGDMGAPQMEEAMVPN